jgi:putative PEP-CTERM system histidine kinase
MTYLIFIGILGAVGIIGAFILAFQARWPHGRVLLPLLSILLCSAGYAEYFASFDVDLVTKTLWTRCAVVLHFFIAVWLLELTVSLLGKERLNSPFKIGSRPVLLRYFWRPVALIAVEIAILAPWFSFARNETDVLVLLNRIGEALFAALFCFHLLTLYVIEKIFRNTSTMQKRIFALYLASAGCIALGSMVLLVRILFFKIVSFEIIQIHAALCAIFFPGMLIALTRYQLWQERIVIGRGMVYTSITVLFFGLFLVSLGVIASAVRLLGIHFDKFEAFVMLFTFLFLGILTFFSPHMRTAITAFSRKYIYKSKYDYRDQLLRLHAAHETSGNVLQTIRAFIDNLRYTIIVKNAVVFLRSSNENSFYRMEDPSSPTRGEPVTLRANSLLVRLFDNNTVTAISVDHPGVDDVTTALELERQLIDKLSISHLFAIKHEELLVGILGITAGKRLFDSEDLMLITMFCESIGTAIFRDRIQRERIEQKQFESFSHMASFIVHDIKNQVATLSLLTKNAMENISNPDFQPVLLRSLENCSGNLNILVQKLQAPPKKELLSKNEIDCNTIVSGVIDQIRGALPNGIKIETIIPQIPPVAADATALSYVLKNLIINAIEALGKTGVITCATGPLTTMVQDDTFHFGLTAADRGEHALFIMVQDNGPGMSRSFVEQKLFKPFNTTKDKGIGIGLYQCKTLIESMNGRLLCWSEEGRGTRFCILL